MHMTGESTNQEMRREQNAVDRRDEGHFATPWRVQWAAFGLLVALGVASRLVCEDLPNFAPVAAIALFAGYYFRSALMAWSVPLSVMAISDYFMGGYSWHMMALVYSMLALPVACRGWLRRHTFADGELSSQAVRGAASVGACGLLASVTYFVVTNFGVWLWFGSYTPDLNGLWQCYVAAIPFFRYTLAGNLFFSLLLFGTYATAWLLATQRAPSVARASQ